MYTEAVQESLFSPDSWCGKTSPERSTPTGGDFRAVLEETIRVAEPNAPDVPLPAKGKWPMADAWYGDGWSVAYRVLDSQFWGVPQRRRRIALVADFGGHAALEILFVRESLCWDIAESGAAGEEAAAGTGSGAETAGVICLNDQGGSVMGTSVDVAGTLRAQEHGRQPVVCAGFQHKAGSRTRGIGYEAERSPTLTSEQLAAVYVHQNQLGEVRTGPVAGTLNTNSNASGRNAPLVFDARGNGDGDRKTACTLTRDHQSRVTDYTAIVMATGQGGAEILDNLCPTLNCNHEQPIVTGVDCRNGTESPDVVATLQAHNNGGFSLNCTHPVRIGGQVRRLTPPECERLQGYPDGWTDIGPWTDSAGKLHKESSDSARYKALGNSIALPPWAWVLKRLCACYERTETMASLFDGIGGFPLIWERLNGPGTCLCANEIEEFPIAVTRRRFGGKEG